MTDTLLTAGDNPPRSIHLGEPHQGHCDCCQRDRDVITLTTYTPGAEIHTGVPGGTQTVHTALKVDDTTALGHTDVCGLCIAGALAVRFAAAAANLQEQLNEKDQP